MTNLKKLLTYYSTWVVLAISAIPSAWAEAPQEWKDQITPEMMPYVSAIMLVAFLVARVIPQK